MFWRLGAGRGLLVKDPVDGGVRDTVVSLIPLDPLNQFDAVYYPRAVL